jgi:cell division protein FtsW (lipid II flippase)
MAITRSTAAERELRATRYAYPGTTGTRTLETYLLLAGSSVIVLGLFLVYQARMSELENEAARGQRVNLNQVRTVEELLPRLGLFPDPEDRTFAARRIRERLRERELESVGELGSIRVTADEIRRTRGLDLYASRLSDVIEQSGKNASPSLPLLTGAQLRQVRPFFVVRTEHEFRSLLIVYSLILLAAVYAVHVAWRLVRFGGDLILLPLGHLLTGIGTLMMLSLRDPLRDRPLFPDFILGIALGCVLLFFCSRPDYESTLLRRLAYIPLLASFGLSVMLVVFGSGPGVSDAKVNLILGPFSTQPVELIKILLLLFLAGYFAQRWEFFRELQEPRVRLPRWLRGFDVPRLQYAVPVVAGVALAIGFFFLQKDLGPALVFALLFLSLYAIARGRALALVLGCAALILTFAVGYQLTMPRTVAARVAVWLSPWDNYIRPGGDHLAQSLWTFASGGTFGSGLGLGDPESVPAIHTDFVLAAAGEELGFIGLLGIYLLYGLLIDRALKISLGARGHYTLFLGLGLALLLGFQVALISGGILGLVPLSGVVTPFLNYGKSSTIVNFIVLGILAAISAHPSAPGQNEMFRKPVRWVGGILAALAATVLIQAARIQIVDNDNFMIAGILGVQADGHRRYSYNPRILAAARQIDRGSIFDRNGIPLAVSSREPLESRRAEFQKLGIVLEETLDPYAARQYPFGGLTFHLLGDLRSRVNWGAPNTAFVERDFNVKLQGYDDGARVVRVKDTPEGVAHPVLKYDYRELIPLVRYRHLPEHEQVQELLRRDRDLRLSIDIRLQKQVAEILEQHIRGAGSEKGAAIVLDPATGELLASATYPWSAAMDGGGLMEDADENPGRNESRLDRARFGLYPPGSVFKLITASAAMEAQPDAEKETFVCKRLPDGRVGNVVQGRTRPVRDDVLDTSPHGSVDMARGIAISCNAYFAQLGSYVVGAEKLLRVADFFGIRVASPNTPARLKAALPQASYGQGQVVASPMQMARVAAAIGNGGKTQTVGLIAGVTTQGQQVFLPEHARLLAAAMRAAVTGGTGKALKDLPIPVAGKTGTAELSARPSHAWFAGFAPYGSSARKRIAFAVIVENGRYGGRVAAPLAGEIITAAARQKLIE